MEGVLNMSEQNLKQVLAKKQSILQGDAERIAKQRAAGKLTARERVAKLLDAGSFVETDALVSRNGDYAGVVTGSGTVQDRPVYVFAQDFTVHGGAMGQMQAQKIVKVLDLAQKTGAPVIALCDSAGVRIDEGAAAMNAYASVFTRLAKLSGVVPVIALVLGPVVGGAAMIAQLADITIEAENVGQLMVYGPQVMSAISGKTVDAKAVGGAKAMAAQGGVALTAKDEDEAISLAVQVLDYLPGCNAEDAAIVDTDDMNRILPVLDAADAESQLAAMADGAAYVELFKDYGKEIRVALTRVGGRPVGLVVGNGKENDGVLTAQSASKAARFIRLCDCYSLPVVSLINSKGVAVPAVDEQAATIKATTQLLYAYAEATTATYVADKLSDGEVTAQDARQTVNVVMVICVCDPDPNRQGYRDALHIVNEIVRHYERDGIVANRYEAQHPIRWAAQEEDTHPYYFAAVGLPFYAPAIFKEVPET